MHEAVHDERVEQIVEEVGQLRQGEPALGEVDLGSTTTASRCDGSCGGFPASDRPYRRALRLLRYLFR